MSDIIRLTETLNTGSLIIQVQYYNTRIYIFVFLVYSL